MQFTPIAPLLGASYSRRSYHFTVHCSLPRLVTVSPSSPPYPILVTRHDPPTLPPHSSHPSRPSRPSRPLQATPRLVNRALQPLTPQYYLFFVTMTQKKCLFPNNSPPFYPNLFFFWPFCCSFLLVVMLGRGGRGPGSRKFANIEEFEF